MAMYRGMAAAGFRGFGDQGLGLKGLENKDEGYCIVLLVVRI